MDEAQFPLGKLLPRHDSRTLLFASYLQPDKLPPPPTSCYWNAKVGSWPMMGNDKIGDCTCASAGHLIECWSDNAGKPTVPTDAQIISAYSAITGYNPKTGSNDNGAVCLDVLNFWRKTGIAGHRIGAYAAIKPGHHAQIQNAVFLFGGSYIGVALPLSAQNQAIWDVPTAGLHGRGARGSWGGHAVPVVGYDAGGLIVVTWGQLKKMTWKFWDAYCDEAFAVLSGDWFNQNKSPSGFNLAALTQDLHQVAL